MNISSYAIQCSVCDFAEDNYWSENFSYNFEWALKSFIRDLKIGTIYDGYDPDLNLLDGVESLAKRFISDVKRYFENVGRDSYIFFQKD